MGFAELISGCDHKVSISIPVFLFPLSKFLGVEGESHIEYIFCLLTISLCLSRQVEFPSPSAVRVDSSWPTLCWHLRAVLSHPALRGTLQGSHFAWGLNNFPAIQGSVFTFLIKYLFNLCSFFNCILYLELLSNEVCFYVCQTQIFPLSLWFVSCSESPALEGSVVQQF